MASTVSTTGMSARDPTGTSVKESSWNGVALAEAAERDEVISVDLLQEEVGGEDGEDVSSSIETDNSQNSRLKPDEEKDPDLPRKHDDQLLEELIRLKVLLQTFYILNVDSF